MFGSLLITLMMFAAQNGQEYYQQALVQERAAGNLAAAIQLYEDAARYAGNDRALAAKALLAAARCYEKLGQAKALEVYQNVAKDYADQAQPAAQARERAHALQPTTFHRDDGATPSWVAGNVVVRPNGVFFFKETTFDMNQPIVIRGKISGVEWVNPSSTLAVAVAGPNGANTVYSVRGASPNTLVKNGINRDTLKLGTEVTVEGFRSADGNSLLIGHATLTIPDGRRLDFGASVSGK